MKRLVIAATAVSAMVIVFLIAGASFVTALEVQTIDASTPLD